MVWSYSRVKAFDDCPYRWFLKYIQPVLLIRHVFGGRKPTRTEIDTAYARGELDQEDVTLLYSYLGIERKNMFFADYGTFMHKLIELHYRGEKTPAELRNIYLRDFKECAGKSAPNPKIFGNYFRAGLQYLKDFKPFPYEPLAVEKKVDCNINGIPFVGYIDFFGMDQDSSLVIVDHKSRNLKPRSRRGKPTKTDTELDSYLIQLYLYSSAIEQEYGMLPKLLCFNCFRTPVLIKEPFVDAAYQKAQQWLTEKVAKIERETTFVPNADYFKCKHLCELQDCCGYCALQEKR